MDQYIDQNNWPDNLEDAKVFANDAVDNFKYKDKAPAFKRYIALSRSIEKLQFMIINAMLSGENMGVVK